MARIHDVGRHTTPPEVSDLEALSREAFATIPAELRRHLGNVVIQAAMGGATNVQGIKALTFDTGGTILDWHTGIRSALATQGAARTIEADWAALTNEFRRRSLRRMLNHGEHEPATLNF